MTVEARAPTGAGEDGALMRITLRAVLTASVSARSPGDETLAKRWSTVLPLIAKGGEGAALDATV